MNRAIIDIETGPLPDTAERIRDIYPFRPEKVALGNRKDPQKIAEHVAAAEVEHYAKLEDKALLDPFLSRLVAVGRIEAGESAIVADPDERAIVRYVWDHVSLTTGEIVGWNLHGFDLPYLIKRSWVLGIMIPSGIRNGRYFDRRFIDLMKEFCLHEYGQMCGLEKAAKMLGVNRPREHGIEGKDFWRVLENYPVTAMAYLEDDLLETAAIADIIL